MNGDELQDYYGLLGVPRSATVSEIHKAYWRLASRSHPDKGGNHESMVRLVEAWKILSDPDKRARYDQLIKYRNDGWRSRKFNADVQEARRHAKEHAAQSWAEFEEIYQKAFYTFNRDFYGEDIEKNAAGPYSPLMAAKSTTTATTHSVKNTPASAVTTSRVVSVIITIALLFATVTVSLFFYRHYIGIGRYVPLEAQDGSTVLMLDTASGTVYSAEKKDGILATPWKERVPAVPRQQ